MVKIGDRVFQPSKDKTKVLFMGMVISVSKVGVIAKSDDKELFLPNGTFSQVSPDIEHTLLKGDKGDTGSAGEGGPRGDRGEPGRDGRDGISIKGVPGRDGKGGKDGRDGKGIVGPQGPKGERGPKGEPGKDWDEKRSQRIIAVRGGGGATKPAGSDKQIQFNDGGVFGGDAGMVYNKTTNALTVDGTVTSNNYFYVDNPLLLVGSLFSSVSTFELKGADTQFALAVGGKSTIINAGRSATKVLSIGGTFVESSSGNHPLIAGTSIKTPIITDNAATVSDTATLYVEGAPSTTVSGKNHSLWVDAGISRFDDDIYMDNGGGIFAIFDAGSITTSDKTLTLPDATGTFALQSSASGSFTTVDGKTVTVVNGIITSIA